MNRRALAVPAAIIAVVLFVAPLVSPIPNPDPHVRVDIGEPRPDPLPERYGQVTETTYRYRNLSTAAQRFFDTYAPRDGVTSIARDEVPSPWVQSSNSTAATIATTSGQVIKDDQYHAMYLGAYTPQPPFWAAIIRFGALIIAITLGTFSAYLIFTSKN